jgi:hypothetical protein
MLDGTVVGWVADRAVERQDTFPGEEALDDGRVEWRAVVAFEEQWRAVTGAETVEPVEVTLCRFGSENQRLEVEVRGEVTGEHDHHAGIGGRGSQMKGIDGPGEVGLVPYDVKFCITQTSKVDAA